MAIVVKDRVRVVSATTGTADFVLGTAPSGYQTFSAIGNTNFTYYAAVDPATGDWEVGYGQYTTAGPTLTRTTILSSSAAGAKISFGAGDKDVFCTYPSERSVYLDSAGSYPVQNTFNTLNATTATLTAGTVSTTPSSGNDLANKTYVDTVAAAGIHYHTPVYVESPNTAGSLNATYNQPGGAGVGVGATLTNAGTKAALVIDGVLMTTTKRVLIYNQTNAYENGVYTVTTVGTPDPGGTNWVLTRATDADTYAPSSPNSLGQGDAFFVTNGDTGAGEGYVCTTVGVITFGTTAITFSQFSAAQVYSAGTGLNLSPATTFNISNVGTAGTYGSSSNVPVFVTNAQGQVTSVTNTAIAIAAGAVSGLAASATTDTTNADNITSGTLGTSRLSGSYTGVTGVGTLTAGTWNASTIGAAYGGTGQSSYAVGDIVYADTTTTLAKLPDVAVGNALISGGVNAAPSYGKIGLATHVDGTLPTANGGTNLTGFTANGVLYASSTTALTTGTDLTFDGTALNLGGTGKRITGDFSNATVANRVAFQSSTTNGNTNINAFPNGTGDTATINFYKNAADLANSSTASFGIGLGSGTEVRTTSGITGTGTYLPMTFYTGGSERVRIDTAGITKFRGTGSAYDSTPGDGVSDALYLQVDSSGIAHIDSYAGSGTTTLAFGTNSGGGAVVEAMRIDSSGNVLIGETGQTWDELLGARRTTTTGVVAGFYASSGAYTSTVVRAQAENATGTAFYLFEGRGSGGAVKFSVDGAGNGYFGGNVYIKAGTATVAPFTLNAGTNLTTPVAGTVEYDGVRFYGTADTTSGRGYVPSAQIFRLAANGSAIGPAINNFFGANSAINLSANAEYELVAYLYFTKTTAGTVVVTLTSSVAVVNLNGTVDYGAVAGGTATGAANRISLFANASTAAAFGASGSLTTGANHAFIVRAVFDSAASASNMRINVTSSAGTVTPLRNSYYKITRLPDSNTGSFAA